MERLVIPNTDVVLYPGAIVILAEYPYTKFIVNHGWYTYRNQQLNGWYFTSIADGTILSLSNVNLETITLVDQGDPHHHHPHPGPHPPFPPAPGPMPGPLPKPGGFTSRDADQLRRSFIVVDSIKQRDALDDGNLPNGKICRVNNVNGKTKYYAYDVTVSAWIEQPIDFVTETVADEKYVTKDEFNWELMSDSNM